MVGCSRFCSYLQIWRQSTAVCFDFDSTLAKDEYIDQLAEYVGKGKEVADLTRSAMTGTVLFEDAFDARLKTINITERDLQSFVNTKPTKLSEGAEKLVSKLHELKVAVYIVSGSFLQALLPVTRELGIPDERVFTNKLYFDSNGCYVDFQRDLPTARQGGKHTVCKLIKEKFGHKFLTFVGDGATDLETYDPPVAADLFIGYGGNVTREIVRKGAPVFVNSFNTLSEWLDPIKGRQCHCHELSTNGVLFRE